MGTRLGSCRATHPPADPGEARARRRLRFAPLQSAPAQAHLRAQGLPTTDFDSIVFVRDWNAPAEGHYRLRTDGVFAALDEVGGVWRVFAWLRLLPAALRDPGYKLVARTRYALFGEYQPRPLPDPAWAPRFLALPAGASAGARG